PPRELNPDVTEAVEIVVLRGLEKQPSQRYDSAEMMANALNLALGRKLSTISYPAVKMEQRLVSATRRRGRTFTIAGSIVLLFLTAALVVMALRTVPPSAETTPTITPLAERFASTILAAQTGSAVDAAPSIEEISR